jgi:hypothetical protein
MNEYVKTLCEEAKITEPFEVNTYKGRKNHFNNRKAQTCYYTYWTAYTF